MAQKELTVFVLDVGADMAHISNHRDISDLDLGSRYVQDTILTKVFRERKTDLVSVIQVESDTTENSYHLDNVYECFDIVQPFYHHLKHLHPSPSKIHAGKSSAGIVRALLFTFQKITAFTGKKKFKKNVVLVTNSRSAPELDEEFVEAIVTLVTSAQVEITLIGVDFDEDLEGERLKNKQTWENLFAKLPLSNIITGEDVEMILSSTRPKLVKPTRTFRGALNIGMDHLSEMFDPSSRIDCLSIHVDGFPAIKPDKPPTRKTFGVDPSSGTPVPITRQMEYEIRNYQDTSLNASELENADVDDLERRRYDPVEVPKEALVKGYKYGRSTVVLNPALEEERVYRTSPGLDICAVFPEENLARCYLAGEAMFIVAYQDSKRDALALNAIVDVLMEIESVAVARYCAKPNAEVQMVVLIPVFVNSESEVLTRKRKHDKPDDATRALILTRLPFYEDEKLATFRDLSEVKTTSGKVLTEHPLLPSDEALTLMGDLVDEMDLDTLQTRETDFVDGKRVFNAMNDTYGRAQHDILVKDSVGIQRVNQVMKTIAMESAKVAGGLVEYCKREDVIPPMPESIKKKVETPAELAEAGAATLKKLEESLKVEMVDKSKFERRRRVQDEIEDLPEWDDEYELEALLARTRQK